MASEEKKKTLHELGIFQTRKPILSLPEDKPPIEKKKSLDKSTELLPPPSPSTKNEKENEEKGGDEDESKKDEMTSSTISSGFSSGTINRRRREIVIPIRPTGETYRRGGSFKERNTDPRPLDLMSTSMIALPSEKRNFVVPQISLPRDLRSTSPPSQKIVMRKKKTDTDCTADTVIIAPKVKQTAVKTIVSPSPPAKECVQLSVTVPKPAAPSAETRREVATLQRKEEEAKEKKEEERRGKLTDEVDALEAEIGRRLALISNKSEEIAKSLEKTQSAPLSPASTASMKVVKTSSSSTLPRSITTITQPIDLLPSSLPPKKKDEKMSEETKPRSSSGNLASRVKESIADFTTGSTDRLQRWKSKLHTGRRIREKDSSAPPPLVRTMQSSSPEVLVDWSVRPRPLHITRSASNAMTLHENGMEHRTLKFSTQQPVYHNAHPMSRQSFNSHNLPPPARIVPFSGSRAFENSDIIRPIAYRAHGNEEMSRRPYPQKIELTKSALNLSTSGVVVSRPRAVFPSTSNSFSVVRQQENEYDTVSDIIVDKEKNNSDGGSDYCKFSASSGSNGGSIGNNSRKTTSRQSTGAHITPSPSDSGIVDYETMIRDKENELADVRKTMEQNEEIIVKVYLEKERSWKDQLEQMRNRLSASEKGESALRMQVANLSRQTEAMTGKMEKLEDDKIRLTVRLRELESRECPSCSSHSQQRHSPPNSSRPVPAPRTFKSASGTDLDLRDEVSELRREVATLKDALQFIPESKRNAIYANNNSISLRDRLI